MTYTVLRSRQECLDAGKRTSEDSSGCYIIDDKQVACPTCLDNGGRDERLRGMREMVAWSKVPEEESSRERSLRCCLRLDREDRTVSNFDKQSG